jgi:hypothetical protein
LNSICAYQLNLVASHGKNNVNRWKRLMHHNHTVNRKVRLWNSTVFGPKQVIPDIIKSNTLHEVMVSL